MDDQQVAHPECVTNNLGWLLWQASFALATELTAALEAIGVSPRNHCVLAAAAAGAHTQSDLAQMVSVDKTTMVATIDELEASGLAERRPCKHDRRARMIHVTEAGHDAITRANALMEALQVDVLGALGTDGGEAFMVDLRRLVGGRLSTPVHCDKPVRRRAPRAQ